jgi:hypothetical protein
VSRSEFSHLLDGNDAVKVGGVSLETVDYRCSGGIRIDLLFEFVRRRGLTKFCCCCSSFSDASSAYQRFFFFSENIELSLMPSKASTSVMKSYCKTCMIFFFEIDHIKGCYSLIEYSSYFITIEE